MKLGFHSATTMTSDLRTDVAATARAGFKALELWAAKVDRFLTAHSLEDLHALLRDADISPMTINSIEFISFRSGEDYAQILARCRELSQIAHALGCPAVIVVPSPSPDRDITWKAVVQEHVRVLRDLSDIAGEYGVSLAFEFLGFGWCSVRTPRGAWEIVQQAGRNNVGLVVDAAHFYGGGGLLSEFDLLDPRRILTFHLDDLEDTPKEEISDSKRLLPGMGVVPLSEICTRLKKVGYDGPCSIELFRPQYWGWDPYELAAKARVAARKVLSPYFNVD
jgi:2-keto-myo-inositol isomerase